MQLRAREDAVVPRYIGADFDSHIHHLRGAPRVLSFFLKNEEQKAIVLCILFLNVSNSADLVAFAAPANAAELRKAPAPSTVDKGPS